VVVNRKLGLSRQERRRLRALAHRLVHGNAGAADGSRAKLEGKIAYLSMLNAEEAASLRAALEG
jgi:RNA-directed DNA polymerase